MEAMVQKNKQGFTIIEMLIVILITAIMAAVAIPQFMDYRREARDAKTNMYLGAIREGINMQYAQMKARCYSNTGEAFEQPYPLAADIEANDVTTTGQATSANDADGCDQADIVDPRERRFVASDNLPGNPWSRGTAAQDGNGAASGTAQPMKENATVTSCTPATTQLAKDGGCARDCTPCDNTANYTGGWCYNPATGEIWADSYNNGGITDTTDPDFEKTKAECLF